MLLLRVYIILFFFSSRRRHTRLQGDWSSDVCSSDLTVRSVGRPTQAVWFPSRMAFATDRWSSSSVTSPKGISTSRSEERRVGKERRARGEADERKKKED